MTYRVRSFKCSARSSDASAWCDECDWRDRGEQGQTAKICRHAKRHAEQTGHEVRIDITRQRGYKLHENQDAKAK